MFQYFLGVGCNQSVFEVLGPQARRAAARVFAERTDRFFDSISVYARGQGSVDGTEEAEVEGAGST